MSATCRERSFVVLGFVGKATEDCRRGEGNLAAAPDVIVWLEGRMFLPSSYHFPLYLHH